MEASHLEASSKLKANADMSHSASSPSPPSQLLCLETTRKEKAQAVGVRDKIQGFLAWIAEFCSAVFLIFMNKALMQGMSFKFPVSLTALHFLCTAVGARFFANFQARNAVANAARASTCTKDSKNNVTGNEHDHHITAAALVAFAVVSGFAVILSNASLCLNSVAFYQIMKLPVLVFVAALESASQVKSYSVQEYACFALILVGVGVTIKGIVRTTVAGAVVAVASVASTGMHQFFCGRLQSWHALNASQLLAKVSPLKAAMLIICGPFLDKLFFGGNLLEVKWKGSILALVSLTCTLAVILNISQYSVIRFLGAGTYQALSQLKTVVIITIGSLLFDRKVNAWQLLGASTAIIGVSLLLSRDQCYFQQRDEKSENSTKQESDFLIPAQGKLSS